MNSIEQNPLAIINLLKSNGNSKQDWGLLLSELITNNSIVNLGTITQIIKYLKENIKIDLILDVCDFILDYGSDDFISTFVIYFNEIYYLDSNKGVYLDKSIVKKKLFLIQKWANKHGRVYPKFQEKYDELKSKKIKFPSLDSKIETYLNYINEEEILKIKNICEHQNRFKELRKTCFYHEQNNEKKMENESNNPEKPKVGESKNHIQIETNIVFSNNNNKPHQNEKKNKHILKNADNDGKYKNESLNNIKKENEEMTPNGGPNQAPISFNSGSNMDPNLGTTSYNPTPGNKDNNIIREDDNIKSSRNMNIQDNKPYRFIKTEDLNKKDIKNEDKKSENDKIFTNKGNKDNNNSQQLFNNGKQTIGNKMNFGLDELYKYNNTNVNDNISTNETNVINNNPNNNKNKNLQPNDELINNIIKNNISTTSDFTLEHNITNNINKSIDKNSNNQNNKIINDVRNLNNNNNNDNYNHNYNNNINNNLSYSKGNINNPSSISLGSRNINNSNNSLNNNINLNYKINNKKDNNIINLNNFQNNNIINNPSNNNKNNYANYNAIINHSSNNNINHFSNNNNINNYSNKKFIYNNSNNNINSNNLNGEIKPNKLLGSYDKYLPNYNIKNSYLRLMDLDLFKRKIEKEVKKLNSWINEGFISYHNTYTSNLKMGIENLKKELPLCDKLIEFYKGTNNLGSLNIVKNIKDSIINLFSRYEEFIKENFEIKILHRSCFNQNQNNPIYEKNRNSIL